MLKARQLNLSIYLLPVFILLAASVFIIAKPHLQNSNALPVFTDEITIVQNTVPVVNSKDSAVSKVTAKTMPSPTSPIPLPIIPPKVIHKVIPVYPFKALEKGIEGTVILSVRIGSSGIPGSVDIKHSSGFESLDEAATSAVSQWKFTPATRGNQVIESCFEVPVSFRIK